MTTDFWSGVGLAALGGVFLLYGLTSKPLEFNAWNPVKKPLPIWAARLIYLPLGILFLGLGLRNLISLVLK